MPRTAATPEQIGEFFDQANHALEIVTGRNFHVGYWTGPEDDSSLEEATDRLTDQMIESIRVGQGDFRVLDIGCGLGRPALRLARATGALVTGISVSKEQIAHATAAAKAEGLADRVRFQYADAMSLPFDENSFDAVWFFESIMLMPDRGEALRQAARVLRPGGRIALTEPFERVPVPAHRRDAVDACMANFRTTSIVQLDRYPGLFREAGLRLVELRDITGNTITGSMTRYIDALLSNQPEVTDSVGQETAERMMRGFERLQNTPEVGYLHLVAVRVGDGQP
ncbi:methyltransferase domain-containing protein [Wenjunlia tyrosinilytica]|uniref:Methyltransferase type 11 n=1 Tax=Wenjunlia tyrosinilytica TaxID=1544741 RepID=A0A918E1D1_9ACTN|nr:methyltransferase domain-containing protein [Wenjunlia tyrosinilytica]GGO97301.1 methyltransferase type 11 [Wenjunlia tyrosinilytica]